MGLILRAENNENQCVSDTYCGLTKREYFAGLAMQGLLSSNRLNTNNMDAYAQTAVKYADALLNELLKPIKK